MRLPQAQGRTARVVAVQQKQRTGIGFCDFPKVCNTAFSQMQRRSCVPEHLNRSSHVAVSIDQALTLKQRVPISFRVGQCPMM